MRSFSVNMSPLRFSSVTSSLRPACSPSVLAMASAAAAGSVDTRKQASAYVIFMVCLPLFLSPDYLRAFLLLRHLEAAVPVGGRRRHEEVAAAGGIQLGDGVAGSKPLELLVRRFEA